MAASTAALAQDSDNDGLGGLADPCPSEPRNLCAGAVAVDSVLGLPIRLNANVSSAECSGSKIDCNGETWAGDFGYNLSASGAVCNLGGGGEGCVITGISALFGCDSEETEDLFQCEHYDTATAPELSYTFNVANGRYIVNLFFANTYTGTESVGARVFDIAVEGAIAYDNFDQVAAAGGSGKALVRSVDVTVADGNGLQIELLRVKQNPTVKAIEVVQVGCTIDPQTGTCAVQPVEFGQSTLSGAAGLDNPTSLAFGPDGRLYVSQQNGLIRAYTVTRSAANSYAVSAAESISLVQSIPNHNDDGTLASGYTTRQVTGIVAAGTANTPVLYVSSSDPRIGGGSNSTDKNVDTNSGVVSRLTRSNGTWQKLDLVRGLPRSAENHASNGMAFDPVGNVLYLAQGGHTNMGAPSNNFVYIPEYALSAAILSIDLDAIGNTTYDLPTLNDESRSGTIDAGDPFGGNDGKNQAKLVSGGPVQVYSPGYRNPYDLVITSAGRMYITDNGPNSNWGGLPAGEGTTSCTNAASEPGSTLKDRLHHVSGPGYYGGHANPTRGWSGNTFNASNPQSPVPAGNPVECDYRSPGVGDGSIAIFNKSTNGITEYTTAHFDGQLQGNLLAASFDKQIWRIQLTSDGTQVASLAPLFSNVGATPLDVIASRVEDPFPGTVWVADHAGDTIFVFEPAAAPDCNSAAECNDTNPCTSDSCIGGTCQHTFNTAPCDDTVACTTGDTCAAGICTGSDVCTLGQTCNAETGQCEGVIDPLVDMTIEDFHLPGTQVGDVSPDILETSNGCTGCHGPYDVDNDMYSTWRGSLMGLAGRDPLFYAQMTTANQDVANVGYFCMRCHVPMSFVTEHALDADGSTLDDTDRDGVTCHFCHSMVDPIYKPGISPVEDLTVLATHDQVPSYYGNSMFVLDPSGLRRGPYDDANAQHDWVASPFHRSSDMCGTCHDVGNVAVTKQPDGTYRYNDIGQASPTEDLHEMFPLERTYTEWKLSAFARGGVDLSGRFGGAGATVVETCQDCHMPRVSAPGCLFTDARPDLPRHEFAGASAQVLDLIAEHYADDPAVDLPSIARSRAAAVSMLERAASLELAQTGTGLDVRVINETGHKIPTGHIEGRRIWLHVRFLGASGATIAEHGHYDADEAELDEASTVVFEMHVGLSADAAAATGYPAGPTGHMALADTIEKDNRIPPRGFDNAAYEAAGAPVVGEVYADEQHWHDSRFEIPAGAVRAEVTLYYQNTPRHYIEELRDNNRSDHWGDTLFDLWERTGKGAPIPMQSASLSLAAACSASNDCDDGNACNGAELCNASGICVAGTPLVCGDGNVCNGTETCGPTSGCQAGTVLSCNDGNACNGVETCNPSAGCQAGTPIDCDDGDPCTADSCSGGTCRHEGSCPGAGSVTVDPASVRSACVGTAGDTITIPAVPVGAQLDRVLIVTVGAEENNEDCNLASPSATARYGTLPMSKASTAVSGTSSWRACNGIFYLPDPPTGVADVVVTFPATTGTAIDNRHAGAFVLYGAASGAPEATAASGANTTTNPIQTAITPLTAGSIIVDVVTQGEIGSFAPQQPGQVEQWDRSCASSSSATSILPVTTAGPTQLGWSHTKPKRYAHALAVFSPSGTVATTTTVTTNTTTTTTLQPSADTVCVAAAADSTAVFSGAMTKSGAYAGGADLDPARDSLGAELVFANSTTNSTNASNPDSVTYVVTLPETASWYLWGRFYYPGAPGSNDANSFFAGVDGGTGFKLGNNKSYFRTWHWDGDGNLETGTPKGLALGTLAAGAHTLKISKREVVPIPPRLDVLCLTRNGSTPPSDAAVATLLGLP